MEGIKVNEYVRTTDGIKKIVQINEGKLSTYYGKYIVSPEYKNSKSINIKNILKNSPNKIDLIEVGDIVNDYKILEIDDMNRSDKKAFTVFKHNEHSYIMIWGEEDIKTILTKEQYEVNCYKSEV